MLDLAFAWVAFALLFFASLAFGENRRRALTALVALIAILSAYLVGSWNADFAPALPFSACFAIALASLETKIFPWLAVASAGVFAGFLAFGISVEAVCAGFAIAIFSRYAAEWVARNAERRIPHGFFYSTYKKPGAAMADEESGLFEYRRKGFHFLGGMLMLAAILFLGKEASVLLFCAAALASLFVISSIAVTGRSAFEPLIELFERHGKRPLDGVLWFLVGAIALLLFSEKTAFVLAGVFVMAAGDSGAAIFGKKFGAIKWLHNKKKSILGTLAFAACSLPALLFVNSPVASAAILACALLESLNWSIDDNIIAAIVFVVASYA